MTEIREDMLKVKRMISEVEIHIGKREGETELVNNLIDAENLLTYCMSRLENAIVPPCKVGDTVYMPFVENDLKEIIPKALPLVVQGVAITKHIPEGIIRAKLRTQCIDFKFRDFGTRVFHNESETIVQAEKALKERDSQCEQ